MTKDVIECILERRSVRHFKPDPIPEATLGRLVDAARWAPSAGNIQPWKFYVVVNQKVKEQLAEAAYGQSFVARAPVVIVVCALPESSAERYGQRGRELYCLQDTAAAIQNILLAATAYGLGSCWVGAFDEERVKEVLELSRQERPVALIPVGYAEREPKPPARASLDRVVKVVE
ncbi:nitroreductase family protein [Calderihabitans maritimus]|uniref:Nitroreductase n=1 Tax=Calderihabitans maritimus TaxID=1246530 RepID=A0A1Z5HTF1_9FIRM|nr:nitroreductase family protein [Calderihabitans maritimus]GAW92601.1 nitroreductase [Calderihabitans maritimus]